MCRYPFGSGGKRVTTVECRPLSRSSSIRARIGPVYTPKQHRGRGYASRAVAEVSQHYVDHGVRCCLFTDQANPTSNKIYEAIGYRPVTDMVSQVIS